MTLRRSRPFDCFQVSGDSGMLGLPSLPVEGSLAQGLLCPDSGARRQPYDPGLLSRSLGHGDVLRPKDGDKEPEAATTPGAPIAQPSEIPLPAVLTVELDPEISAATCNLLFSQGMHDKLISAETKNAGGDWRATSNIFVRGELVRIALKPDGPTSIRIRLENNPGSSDRTSDTRRPQFGLIEAWTASSARPNAPLGAETSR